MIAAQVLMRLGVRPGRARAAAAGDIAAMVAAANDLTAAGRGPGLAIGVRLYRRAFRAGDTTAAYNLACTYQNLGRHRAAVAWYRRALAAGDASAALQVARAELFGVGTPRATTTALARLRGLTRGPLRTSRFEREEAMLLLASAYLDGWLARRDRAEGVRWLRRAARYGSAAAAGLLADLRG